MLLLLNGLSFVSQLERTCFGGTLFLIRQIVVVYFAVADGLGFTLFLRCIFSVMLWYLVFRWLSFVLVLPSDLSNLLLILYLGVSIRKGRTGAYYDLAFSSLRNLGNKKWRCFI